ncbi:hypothetical protein [Dawidia soli]|uniref:Uncharacterized protein n=1 Tax=Dawidia soli TaxID=2782352 RepID=A0AAP2GBE9_9BACT|nr:hypothetical protein [Dawidia soli]MBT1684982.1 hypothetical protein [Dawidia soli]
MNQQVYDAAKTLHIAGITVAAGMSLMDLILFRYFWNSDPRQPQEGILIEKIIGRLQRVMGIGMLLTIAAGVTMMVYLHAVWGQQLWLRVKMGILLLLIINALSFRRILGKRIHARMTQEQNVQTLRSGMTAVQLTQLVLFLVIFVLSVFRFN